MRRESFGNELRRERERRGISLASIAETTKIRASLFESLERGDVSRWPSGIFRRSFVRAYAEALGLDGDETVREFAELFPDPDALPASGAMARCSAPVRRPVVPPLRLTLDVSAATDESTGAGMSSRRRWAAAACDLALVVAIASAIFVIIGRSWAPLGVAALMYYAGAIILFGTTPGVRLCGRPSHVPMPHRAEPESSYAAAPLADGSLV